MQTCPKCNELNGNNRTDCWKCRTKLDAKKDREMKSYKKICTKCGFIYSKKKQSCDECGSRLSVYSEEYANYGTDNNKDGKIFGLAALIPIIVITLGLIILGVLKDEITANVGLIFGGLII